MAPTLLCMCGRLLELDWIVALLDLRIDALFHKDAVPDHKGQDGPQAQEPVAFGLSMVKPWDSMVSAKSILAPVR